MDDGRSGPGLLFPTPLAREIELKRGNLGGTWAELGLPALSPIWVLPPAIIARSMVAVVILHRRKSRLREG
jgi:hypothetical protein